jgi:hypothetical protein
MEQSGAEQPGAEKKGGSGSCNAGAAEPFSTLELAPDQAAFLPEVDHSANSPEVDQEQFSPKVRMAASVTIVRRADRCKAFYIHRNRRSNRV